MGGNIPGENFVGGNFLGGIWWVGIFRGGIFLQPFNFYRTHLAAAFEMKFFVKDFFIKCKKIREKLWICSYLMKESLR